MSSKQPRGLGRGLGTLIPTNFDSSLLIDEKERVQKLNTKVVQPNPDQPRKHFDPEALEQLASSIKKHGILQPLVVTPNGQDGYTIIAGERRYRAATKAGLTHVPALVRSAKELDQLEIALVENVQRVDLSPLEQAVSIAKLHEQFSMSYQMIAERLGKAVTTVNNIVRLLQLPAEAREALQHGHITEGHARAILSLKDKPEKQRQLLTRIIDEGWSVRQAEHFASAVKTGAGTEKAAVKRTLEQTPETKRLSKFLKTPVKLKHLAKGGQLMIRYKTEEELKTIIARISNEK